MFSWSYENSLNVNVPKDRYVANWNEICRKKITNDATNEWVSDGQTGT